MDEELLQAAMDQALRFLNYRFISASELMQKMRRKGYESDVIEVILEKLISYDYINDTRLAKQYLSFLMKEEKYGIYYIKQKMKQRGLSIPMDIENYDELAVAFTVVDKKYHSTLAEVSMRKVATFLKSRGFSTSTISTVCHTVYS